MPGIVESIDIFKQDLPTFNVRGKTKIASLAGAIMSFAIFTIMLIYGTIKMIQLTSRSNPNIASFVQSNYFDGTHVVNFEKQGLRFAFGIEGQLDRALKDDPRYVKWMVRAMYKVSENERAEKLLPFHRCTEADYDAFSPPSADSAPLFNAYRNNVASHRGLYCFDWDKIGDTLSIWGGSSNDAQYQRIEFVLLPCNYIHA